MKFIIFKLEITIFISSARLESKHIALTSTTMLATVMLSNLPHYPSATPPSWAVAVGLIKLWLQLAKRGAYTKIAHNKNNNHSNNAEKRMRLPLYDRCSSCGYCGSFLLEPF